MTSEILLAFLVTCLVLILTPGPDLLFVISQSITRGKKFGIAVAVGQVGGLFFHLSLFAFGISSLIVSSQWAYEGIKIVGALYLFWLAFSALRSKESIQIEHAEIKSNSLRGFVFKGLVMNVMNPKVMLFFLALFPGFVNEKSGDVTQQILVLGIIFTALTLLVSSVISALAAQCTSYLQNSTSFSLLVKWIQVVVFAALGVYVLL